MSLILDALRKSESERQRGQAPDLFAAAPPQPASRPRPWRAWGGYALAGLLAVALAFLVWRQAKLPATPVTGEAPAVAPAETAATESAVAEPTPVRAAPTEPAPPTPPPTPPPAARPAPPGIADAEPAALRNPATPRAAARPAAPTPTSPTTTAVATTDLPAPPAAPPPPATPAAAATEAPDPAGPRPPRLADLAGDQRAALPPLRLSMHVYAEDPARRFVILDGRRLGEGAAIAEGLHLREIRRDGLVLSVRGDDYWLER